MRTERPTKKVMLKDLIGLLPAYGIHNQARSKKKTYEKATKQVNSRTASNYNNKNDKLMNLRNDEVDEF